MGALFALFLLVRKHSEEKSGVYVESNRSRYTVNEVIIAAIVQFVNALHIYSSNICNQPGQRSCPMQ